MKQRDVIVVGAGPVGLSLALGLARHAVNVLVLEKQASTAEHSRAPAIWPGTQEVLARLGVLGQFEAQGLIVPSLELWDVDRERVLVRLPINELRDETPHARLLIVPQSNTERILCDALRDTDAEIRFCAEAVEVTQDASGVELRYLDRGQEQRVRARFVAGCDGADSTIRKQLNASFTGITYDMKAALADVVPAVRGDLRFPRVTLRPTLAIGIRISPRLWRLILPFSGRAARPLDQRIDDAVRHLFPAAQYETVWKSDFNLHRRVSSCWADGRIVLAGDAAHINSPVGGQGMNAGIMDAERLTRALLAALETDSDSPLGDYVSERREAIEQGVNPLTDRLTKLLLLSRGRLIRPILSAAQLMLRIAPVRRRVLRRLAMLR